MAVAIQPKRLMKVLVVEDDAKIAELISAILKSEDCEPELVSNGKIALKKAKESIYSLIISDIVIPGLSGLELIEKIRKSKPDIPVILMTAYPEVDYAIQALNLGASGFLLKPFNNNELIKKINQIKKLGAGKRGRRPALRHIIHEDHKITFDSRSLMDKNNLFTTATYLSEQFGSSVDRGQTPRLNYALAVHEALRNALEHGNLEVSSALRSQNGLDDFGEAYEKKIVERLADPAYGLRKVFVHLVRSEDEVRVTIRDEGKGFNYQKKLDEESYCEILPDESHGRGLMLIKAYMDDVFYSEKGNEITLVRKL